MIGRLLRLWISRLETPSERDLLALRLVSELGPRCYGLALVEASGGKIARGVVYVRLCRLEVRGLVESVKEDLPPEMADAGYLPRRTYTITDAGRRVLLQPRGVYR